MKRTHTFFIWRSNEFSDDKTQEITTDGSDTDGLCKRLTKSTEVREQV